MDAPLTSTVSLTYNRQGTNGLPWQLCKRYELTSEPLPETKTPPWGLISFAVGGKIQRKLDRTRGKRVHQILSATCRAPAFVQRPLDSPTAWATFDLAEEG